MQQGEIANVEKDDRPVLFEGEEDGLAVRAHAPRGSDVLAVVFSQVRVPAGSFGLSRLFGRTSHACLFLNQHDNRWYRGTAEAVDRTVDRVLDLTGARRLVFWGSSMGAFGAASAAARRPEARAVIFAPDFRIGEPGSQSAGAGLVPDPSEPDLAALLAGPRRGRVDIAAPLFDPYDAGVAARLAAAALPPEVAVLPLASTHEVHDHLFSLNLIRRVISTFTRELAAEAAQKGLLRPQSETEWIARRHLAALAADPDGASPEAVGALGLGGDPGSRLLYADLLAARGRLEEAETELRSLDAAVEKDPQLRRLPKRWRKQIPQTRIALLDALGRPDRADLVAAEAACRFPGDADFAARSAAMSPDRAPGA